MAYEARVMVGMKDLVVLQFCQERSGLGSLRELIHNGKPYFEWNLATRQAEKLLTLLLPYLKGKRSQANKLLDFCSYLHGPGVWHTDNYVQTLESFYRELRDMKCQV